ncbi:MAG TPA: right-handed parallel beta-helix repeat-containing protein [Anaerolineales bacterium]|nr:right-handed parallel beta-helix repeat-containing protein [Anaerolineales bacterium]
MILRRGQRVRLFGAVLALLAYVGLSSLPATGQATDARAPAQPAAAAIHYIRQGAAGAATGADWANAWPTLPATLIRGDTYYIADGQYPGYTFNDPETGSLTITVKKATTNDHGTSIGWQPGYGDGQAVFGGWEVYTDFYVFDGQQRNADWETGAIDAYGLRVKVTGGKAIRLDDGNGNGADDLIFRYIDVEGGGRDTGDSGSDVVYGLTGNSNITFQYCALHDSNRTILLMRGNWRNLTIDHCYLARNASDAAIHGEIVSTTDSQDVVFSNNIIEDPEGTAVWAFINDGLATNWRIFGNVILHSPGYDREGISGVIFCANDASNANVCNEFTIVNNTLWGIEGLWSGFNIQAGSGHVVQNNLWYASVRTANGFDGVLSHNWYYATVQDGDASPSKVVCTTGCDVFVDPAGRDFHLRVAIEPGATLNAPFQIDPDGKARGGDGSWDRGAYEYVPGSPQAYLPLVQK